MHQSLPSQKRPLVGLVAAACLGLSFAAQASVVSTLNAYTSASADGAAASTDNQGPDNASVSSWSSQNATSSAYASAFGVNYSGGGTRYAASASGTGTFSSQATFTKTLTITNNESYAQIYDLSYYIYGGSLSVGNWWWGNPGTGDTGSASLNFRIFDVNDVSNPLLSRNATLTLNSDTTNSFSSSGFIANYTPGDNYVWTNSETGTKSLGVLAAGASKTISYELIAETTGNYHFVGNNNCCYECGYGDGYGYGDIMPTSVINECGYGAGSSYAFLGDPDGINGQGQPGLLNVTGQRYNAVPLPNSLALIGIGLAGLGFARRRKLN